MADIKCIYDRKEGQLLLSKEDVLAIRAFKKIVLNYLKIKRIEEMTKEELNEDVLRTGDLPDVSGKLLRCK